jgi:hypothetical protein
MKAPEKEAKAPEKETVYIARYGCTSSAMDQVIRSLDEWNWKVLKPEDPLPAEPGKVLCLIGVGKVRDDAPFEDARKQFTGWNIMFFALSVNKLAAVYRPVCVTKIVTAQAVIGTHGEFVMTEAANDLDVLSFQLSRHFA